MQVGIVTIFPQMFDDFLSCGIVSRAKEKGLFKCKFYNPRDFATNKYKNIDAKPYGGGLGMLMQVEPLVKAIRQARLDIKTYTKVVYLSPQGKQLNHSALKSQTDNIIFVCGRYEGIDQRVIDLEVDEEWSIGDFILSGGEIPAMAYLDALVRFIPGALGNKDSLNDDSFAKGGLKHPQYAKPRVFENLSVPEVLLNGNHKAIESYHAKQAELETVKKRPDLINKYKK